MLASGSIMALLALFGATAALWPLGGGRRLASPTAQTLQQQLAGEWTDVSDPNTKLTFDGDNVVLSGVEMMPCRYDESARTFGFATRGSKGLVTWSGHLSGDNRLYCRRADIGAAIILGREYTGGWHNPGEVDHGRRMAGLEDADRPPDRTPPGAAGPADTGTAASAGHYRSRANGNADGSMDGTVTGDGYSARSHLNRDGSGDADYSASGRTVHVTRNADGTSTVESR